MTGPTTFEATIGWTLTKARERYDDLVNRDLSVRAAASLRKSGKFDPGNPGHRTIASAEPLSADEHLELVALGDKLARYYAHPVLADRAVHAGASWEQVAAARGISAERAQADHEAWIWGQGSLRDLEAGQ